MKNYILYVLISILSISSTVFSMERDTGTYTEKNILFEEHNGNSKTSLRTTTESQTRHLQQSCYISHFARKYSIQGGIILAIVCIAYRINKAMKNKKLHNLVTTSFFASTATVDQMPV